VITIDVTINSENGKYTAQELRILKAVSGEPALIAPTQTSSVSSTETVKAPVSTKPAASPKPAAKPKPEASHPEDVDPENTADNSPMPDGPEEPGVATLDDAVAKATELVAAGKTAQVKAALAEAGAKRVSELKGKSIGLFLAAL
jgi:hypothetical protein